MLQASHLVSRYDISTATASFLLFNKLKLCLEKNETRNSEREASDRTRCGNLQASSYSKAWKEELRSDRPPFARSSFCRSRTTSIETDLELSLVEQGRTTTLACYCTWVGIQPHIFNLACCKSPIYLLGIRKKLEQPT